MKKKTVTFFGGYDGKSYTVTPAHGTKTQWRQGKCWGAFCRNPVFYIHTTENGNATHGYCPHWREDDLYKYWKRGTWYMLIKGKLKEVKRPTPHRKGVRG